MTDLMGLYRLAEEQGVTIDCFQLVVRESISIQNGDDCFIAIDPFQLTSSRDEKLKLAHELGHCMTGSFYNRYSGLDIRQKQENRADKWAIEELIGEDALNAAVSEGNTEVWQLADYFNVSEEMMKKAICLYKFGNLDVDSSFGQ